MKSLPPNLLKELHGLRDRVESQNCHIATLDRQLRTLLTTTGLGPASAEAHPPALPQRRWRAVPPARPPAPDRGFWPTPETECRPLVPAPGHRAYALKGTALKVIGISVCGFDREDLESLVAFVEHHHSRDRRFTPVFLTDSTDANIFRRHGFVFEYLPPPDRVRLRGSKPWAVYAAQRRSLLARKWGMVDIITFGDVAFGKPSRPGIDRPAGAATEELPPKAKAGEPGRRRGNRISRARSRSAEEFLVHAS